MSRTTIIKERNEGLNTACFALAVHSGTVVLGRGDPNMAIKTGDKVKVNYTGKLEDGTVFDSSTHGDHAHPLEFTVGAGELIKGFDTAVIGMKKGDSKTVTFSAEEGYGPHMKELVKKLPRKPDTPDIKTGTIIGLQTPDGKQFPARVIAIDAKTLTLDLNHPLAGKKLTFTLEIVEC